jgi:glutamyl-tRNA synthetase
MYDRHCRTILPAEAEKRIAAGEPHVVRMKIPDAGEVTFHDEIRGTVSFSCSTIDDQVLLKSDQFPTYHLAVVVDDHLMEISHVIRGEEWLPSTPKHVLLYGYFGWEIPSFAHLPLLLNPDKSKLSKRQGDVAVEDYRDKGYIKEALVNFVALLGWNPGDDREIFSMQELIGEFSLERVGKAGAVFNIEKLNWMNQQHIKLQSDDELLPLVRNELEKKSYAAVSDDYLKQIVGMMKERVTVLNDFIDGCPYFYEDPQQYDESAAAKNWKPESASYVRALHDRLSALADFSAPAIEAALRATAESLGIGAGKLIHPVRLAVSGVSHGPSLFHMMELLGKDSVLRRMEQSMQRLG